MSFVERTHRRYEANGGRGRSGAEGAGFCDGAKDLQPAAVSNGAFRLA
jgi:hypothetical protein